jgi:hypothetical protein
MALVSNYSSVVGASSLGVRVAVGLVLVVIGLAMTLRCKQLGIAFNCMMRESDGALLGARARKYADRIHDSRVMEMTVILFLAAVGLFFLVVGVLALVQAI